MADAGEILAGPIGREVLGAGQIIFVLFACASHVLTGLIAFDTSKHGNFTSVPPSSQVYLQSHLEHHAQSSGRASLLSFV